MTREEAINKLVNARYADEFQGDEELTTAHLMAINALEQQPSEDCISRKKLEKLKRWRFSYDTNTTIPKSDLFVKLTDIKDLPSVTPTQRWIPCSERLPKEMGTYMTTIDYGEHGLVTGQRYYYGRGLKWNDECVIAWTPLPEPYKAEMESE